MNEHKRKSSNSLIVPVALLGLMIGGVGTAVLNSPKNTKLKQSVQELGDEVIDTLDLILSKIEQKTGTQPKNIVGDISHSVITLVEELKMLNNVVKTDEIEETKDDKVQHISDEITQKIFWLQKKGRSLARKNF
ncbi:MAG: hypothetical protein M3P33_00545 [bacterium]|nr:hypothetical protein [bacterium]